MLLPALRPYHRTNVHACQSAAKPLRCTPLPSKSFAAFQLTCALHITLAPPTSHIHTNNAESDMNMLQQCRKGLLVRGTYTGQAHTGHHKQHQAHRQRFPLHSACASSNSACASSRILHAHVTSAIARTTFPASHLSWHHNNKQACSCSITHAHKPPPEHANHLQN
jgi:hypothetical protein